MESANKGSKNHSGIIVITGPESTGKTELAEKLSEHYKVKWQPELARSYIELLDRPYTYDDVEQIAYSQISAYNKAITYELPYVFLDTGLIITKVWFDEVYGKCPPFLIEAIKNSKIELHLLCQTDLPWIPDKVRENGGENRNRLLKIYEAELNKFGFKYEKVFGTGSQRFNNALSILERYNIR